MCGVRIGLYVSVLLFYFVGHASVSFRTCVSRLLFKEMDLDLDLWHSVLCDLRVNANNRTTGYTILRQEDVHKLYTEISLNLYDQFIGEKN